MHIISQDPPINLFDAVKGRTMTINFVTPLTTVEAGKAWIESLHAADMMFHFEDSPETIISGATGGDLFTPEQCPLVRKRVAELYSMDWSTVGHECPIGYALEVMDRA